MKCWFIAVYLVCGDQLICQKLHSRNNIIATGSYFPMEVSHGNRGRINHPTKLTKPRDPLGGLIMTGGAASHVTSSNSMIQTVWAKHYAFLAAAATHRYAPELALGVALLSPQYGLQSIFHDNWRELKERPTDIAHKSVVTE